VEQAEQAVLFDEPTLTVAELSNGIGRAVRRAYPEELWVRGEIANISRSAAGHVYFDLSGEGVSVPTVLFDRDRQAVNRVLQRAGGAVRITDGTDVRVRVRVTWYPRRGQVSLQMMSIDPAYTLGRLAEARELVIGRLRAEGVFERNGRIPLPWVPLRVGLVTSRGSAAEADFLETLRASGFGWHVAAVDARVQGPDAERGVCAAMGALTGRPDSVDVVCIVRGGGARTDLAAFDGESLARAIANLAVPVFTGIGHETDTSIADLAAHTSHKTPTACAAALVERVVAFVARLDRDTGRAEASSRRHLRNHELRLDGVAARVAARAPRLLDAAARTVDGLEGRVRTLDPRHLLGRGWTITRDERGDLVRQSAAVAAGETLVTTFADGSVTSVVRSVEVAADAAEVADG
jgi:exodeoxyribonuclease VII large subunit